MVIEKKKKKRLRIYSRPGAGILHNPVILFTSVRVCAHAVLLKFITRCQVFNFVAEWGLLFSLLTV